MVQGLAFLSKKSWHTKNLNNQEKVWIAEEQAKQEQLKTAELQKQIQQEREEEELQQMAGGARKLDRGIDWMYSGHDKNSAVAQEDATKQAEEYLLGKAVPLATLQKGDLDAAANLPEGVNAVVKTVAQHQQHSEQDYIARKLPPTVAGGWDEEESVAKRNEAFRLRYEDPMYQVSLQTVRHEKQQEQQKELYHKVGMEAVPRSKASPMLVHAVKDGREERARRNKETDDSSEVDERKHMTHRSRKRSRRESSGSDDSRSSASFRSEQRRRRRRRVHRTKEARRSHHRRYESSSEEEDYDKRSDRRKGYHQTRHEEYEASSSYPYDSKQRDIDRRQRRSKYRDDDSDSRSFGRDRDDRWRGEEGNDDRSNRSSTPSYGLQRPSAFQVVERSSSRNVSHVDLGPDPELRRHKRQEKEMERRSIREHASQRRYQSAEDRARALRAMADQAKSREAARWHTDRFLEASDPSPRQGGARFVQEFSQQVHGIRGPQYDSQHHRESMSARLQQNRNSHQRKHDDSFL